MNLLKSFKYISKNNMITMGVMILCYILFDCWLFHSDLQSLVVMILLQLGFVFVAISPIGSWILRTVYKTQKISPNHPVTELFEEVYDEVKENFPNCPRDVKLYFDRDMNVNAYAIGSDTITITRGAVESLNSDQIKGILGHEFGHLVHKDTSISLVFLIGNGIFLIFYALLRLAQIIFSFMGSIMDSAKENDEEKIYGVFAKLINKLIYLFVTAFFFVLNGILAINERKNEYRADYFAYEVNYGEELLSALKILDKMDLSGNRSLIDRIKASHPYTSDRIVEMEKAINGELQQTNEPFNFKALVPVLAVIGVAVVLFFGIRQLAKPKDGECAYCWYYGELKRFSYSGDATYYDVCPTCYEEAENGIIDLSVIDN